jgi:predicted anti-sigma-YlaC factor YlaD
MNEFNSTDCERIEAMMASWFDRDGLSADERGELTAHVAACASCRESFELARQMEDALVSRRDDVPAVDAFLPNIQPARARFAHPRLVAAFRGMMSPAGIAVILVMWSTMLAFRFRESIAGVFELSSSERFTALFGDVSSLLLAVARGNEYTLIGIYVALTLIVLGSTGAITLRYIRHS